jgi:hypothetical protein
VEEEITRLVPEIGISYENGGPIALDGKGVVAAAIDEIRPLCEVEAVETMVAQTGDGGLEGENSPVVTTVVGIEEFPKGVTAFVSIAVFNTVWHS